MTEPEWTEWVGKEYEAWENALAESTVDNFKLNPMVRRMISCDLSADYRDDLAEIDLSQWNNLRKLDGIGMGENFPANLTAAGARFVHWALKIIEAAPRSIVEIGGGCGQLYATLRILGWTGEYQILDLPEAGRFQKKYLERVGELFGVNVDQHAVVRYEHLATQAMCVSFYALGEFPESARQHYMSLITPCPKGLIVWNPALGYSPEINFTFPVEIADEVPLTAPNNKVITWGLK